MTEQPQATKQCRKCGEAKPLLAFAGRQNTCIVCRDAAKAKTLDRKEAIRYSPELGAKICDLIALRTPVAKIVEMAGMPTARQLASWRRMHADFRDAYDLAREQRADARSDRVDEILDDLRVGKIDAPSARVLIEAELKLAAKENPLRYGDRTVADVTVRPGAPIE